MSYTRVAIAASYPKLARRRAFLKLLVSLPLLAVFSRSAVASAECRITVLGDSLAAGYGIALAEAFPARLEEALIDVGRPCEVINAGVSGDTSAGGLSRIDWVLADDPTHLILELGGNDALRALPAAALEANLAGIIERALGRGISVLLAGMLAPPNLGAEYAGEFGAVYPRLADRYGLPLYPFFLDGVVGNEQLMSADGIHPNADGVEVIVERMLPTVIAWLDATTA